MGTDAEVVPKTTEPAEDTAEVTKEKTTETAATTPDQAEESARAKGWKPKDEYKGEPGSWVDAKEFLGREPLFNALKDSRKEIRELKKTVDGMARTFAQQVNSVVSEKLTQLKAQKREAIEAGDPEKVEKIEKQIEEQKKVKVDAPTAREIAPEIHEWVKENPWFNSNPKAKRLAVAENEEYLKEHPDDIKGSLEVARAAVKKAYPEIFGGDKGDNGSKDKEEPAKAPPVESGGAKSGGGKTLTVRQLTTEQKLAHDAYVKAGVLTSAEYLKSLQESLS